MRLALVFAIVLTTGLLAAAPASAGSVCLNGTVATFAAADVASGACLGAIDGPSEVNGLSVAPGSGGGIVFTDTNPITDEDGVGVGCEVAGNTATCPGATGYVFDLGAGGDTATIGAVVPVGTSSGGAGGDRLTGGALADALTGGADNDVIEGGAGDDSLDGGAGADSVDGGDGDDVATGGDDADTVAGGAGNDLVTGGGGSDTVAGGDGNDLLEGGSVAGCAASGGDDVVNGDAGDDWLCGGAGPGSGSDNDALNGGAGEDTAFYGRVAGVVITLDGAASDGQAGEADNVRPDVENVVGGAGDDSLTGSDIRNVLDGARGADSLNGAAGPDVLMDSGADAAADRLEGAAGDDTLAAGRGPDVYSGGDGDDFVSDYGGRIGGVRVTMDGQPDDGEAGEGDNVGADIENLSGGAGNDSIVGNAADNELAGGSGDDEISGGGGNDGLSGNAGRDVLDGGVGRDSVEGNGGADLINSRDGQTDRVVCGGGTDRVSGEARDNIGGDCEDLSIAAPSAVVITRTQVTRAGFVVVRVACPVVERSCAGAVIVKTTRRIARRFIKLGQINYRLRGAQSKVFRARIKAKDRRPLRRAKRVRVRTVVTNVNPDTGASTNATKLATVTTRGL